MAADKKLNVILNCSVMRRCLSSLTSFGKMTLIPFCRKSAAILLHTLTFSMSLPQIDTERMTSVIGKDDICNRPRP
jgi:hypothetical protein